MPLQSGASSSSMNTSTSLGSSWLEGSPSRQSPNRNGRYTPRGSLIRDLNDSPSRKAQIEFNLMLSRNDRDFHERLDQAAAERAKIHAEQLAKAAQEHLRIQEGAQLEIHRLFLEQEKENLRKAEAQRREIEKLQQEKAQQEAEIQRQRLEAKKREEELARQAAEHQRQIQEADARAKAQREQEAAAQRQKEAAEKKAKEEAAAAALAVQAKPIIPPTPLPGSVLSAPNTNPSAVSLPSSSTAGLEELHKKYIALHARMKTFRKEFADEVKKPGHPLKQHVGDARRALRLRLGQIGVDRKSSQEAIKHIREQCFDVALKTTGPTVDIRPYLISQTPNIQQEAEAQFPAFLLYMWIIYSKSVIQSWTSEADTEGGVTLQEVGLITASLFADKNYMFKGTVSMTDIMLAKLHRRCPILFGIRGNTTTQQGVNNLGLDRYRDDENAYARSVTGVSAGYASLCLRHFKGKEPPFPMVNYWRSVALVINTPANDIYSGHYYAAKGLLRDFVQKFLLYYGIAAKAVLRRATTDFANRALKDRPGVPIAADLVKVLADSWKKRYNLVI